MKGTSDSYLALPDEVIISKIYLIRGKKVMLDRDLADLYDTETKQLKRAVRRNIARFPDDFMFELSKDEFKKWRSQFGTSKSDNMGLRIAPFAFTEYGLLMLASVLTSEGTTQISSVSPDLSGLSGLCVTKKTENGYLIRIKPGQGQLSSSPAFPSYQSSPASKSS